MALVTGVRRQKTDGAVAPAGSLLFVILGALLVCGAIAVIVVVSCIPLIVPNKAVARQLTTTVSPPTCDTCIVTYYGTGTVGAAPAATTTCSDACSSSSGTAGVGGDYLYINDAYDYFSGHGCSSITTSPANCYYYDASVSVSGIVAGRAATCNSNTTYYCCCNA